jgi:hypothetical protein
MPRRLPLAQVTAVVAILAVSLAIITGYFLGRPAAQQDDGRGVGTAGVASVATAGGPDERAYTTAAKGIWRRAMGGLEGLNAVVATDDLERIAGVAGELRVRFDVLALDALYLEPPAEMEGAQESLLRALEQSATMLGRADALASEPMDEDAAVSNAELLYAAAQQARSAYQNVAAEMQGLKLSTSVWDGLPRIAELAATERSRQPAQDEWPGTTRPWTAPAREWPTR